MSKTDTGMKARPHLYVGAVVVSFIKNSPGGDAGANAAVAVLLPVRNHDVEGRGEKQAEVLGKLVCISQPEGIQQVQFVYGVPAVPVFAYLVTDEFYVQKVAGRKPDLCTRTIAQAPAEVFGCEL